MLRSPIFRTLSTNVVILGLGLLTSVLLSRALLPVGRGEVTAAMLWPVLLIYFGSFGFIDAIVYFSAQVSNPSRQVFSSGIVACIVQSVIVMSLGYIALPSLLLKQSSDVVQLSRLFLLIIPISLLGQYNMSLLQGHLKFSSYNILRLIVPVSYFLLVALLAITKSLSVPLIICAQLSINGMMMVSSFAAVRLNRIPLGFEWNYDLFRKMLNYGSRVFIGTLFSAANLRLDQVMIAAWLPPEQLGLYVAAVSASNITGILSQSIATVTTPTIAKQETTTARVERLYEAFQKYWTLNLAGTAVLGLLLPWLIPLIYGRDFAPAVIVAEVLLLAAVFYNTKAVLTGATQAFGVPQFASIAEGLGSVLTVIILILLIPTIGILGAAIASAIAYFIAFIFLVFVLQRRYKVSPWIMFQVRPQLAWGLVVRLVSRPAPSNP